MVEWDINDAMAGNARERCNYTNGQLRLSPSGVLYRQLSSIITVLICSGITPVDDPSVQPIHGASCDSPSLNESRTEWMQETNTRLGGHFWSTSWVMRSSSGAVLLCWVVRDEGNPGTTCYSYKRWFIMRMCEIFVDLGVHDNQQVWGRFLRLAPGKLGGMRSTISGT